MIYQSLLRTVCLFALLLLGHTTRAQSIFTNPITGTNPGLQNPYTNNQNISPNIAVSGIGRSASVIGENGNNVYNTSNWNANLYSPLDYIEFVITPSTGYKINFVSFVYTAQISQGPTVFSFRSSVDNFATSIASPPTTGALISLTGAAYQNITSAITFRLYGWLAQTPNGTFSVNDFTFNANTPLPIELTAFRAEAIDGRTAQLAFSTATERNNHYFAIERSQDGARFETIGQVQGAGNSSVPQDYSYIDQHPVKGLNVYRLKQVDFDGAFAYSPVVTLYFSQVGVLHLSPQPVVDQVRVQLGQPAEQDSQWAVYDFGGRLLQSGTLEAEAAEFLVSTVTLAQGAYVLRLVSGQSVLTQQFQKQ